MADSTTGGPACCILGLSCCPPGGLTIEGARKVHLAKKLQSVCVYLSDDDAMKITEALFAEYDLVPAGVGKAIADGYASFVKGPQPKVDR